MKILIAIESCIEHWHRVQAQFETWVNRKDVDFFQCEVRSYDGNYLKVLDDYDHLPQKTKAICQWAKDYDYLFKTDTDSYVSIPRLMASGFENFDYSGFVRDDGFKPEYCYGPAYWLSRKAIKILAEPDWSKYAVAGFETCEDVMVGAVLAAHGIFPHHDPRYALYHDVLPENDIISSHLSNAGKPFKIEYMYEAHRKATSDVCPI